MRDTELIRALLTLSAILGVGGMAGWCFYGTVALRMRAYSRRARRLSERLIEKDRALAGLKIDLLAGARMLKEASDRYEASCKEFEAELLLADAKRRQTQRDLSETQYALALARANELSSLH